ncbi:MAG: hypothetical protein JOZ27_04445 [Caulobacteraceae bacterium]|nr:hypothetical protein [Caulobacteraceae bacterium]
MDGTSQRRAVMKFRARLAERGLARFEVTGRSTDRDLVRAVARRLSDGGPDSSRLRASIEGALDGGPPRTGGVLRALMASPLVGSDIRFDRPRLEGRAVDL